jgi:two-component system NtrC family response regulator
MLSDRAAMSRILIIDDDPDLRAALREAVSDLGYDVEEASNGLTGLAIAAAGEIDAILLDLRMSGVDGLEVLRRLRDTANPPAVTVLTAHATAANTIEAIRLGAVDHLTKPISQDDLRRALEAMLAPRLSRPDRSAATPADPDELIGSSAALRAIQKTIGRLADADATVLITGETGTGKELVARALHRHGRRSGGAFVAVNCAAIPRDLMESELFGHVRGAFTGATADRSGAFRNADGGTLFLDEVGDMDVAMQAKILRVLQDRIVTPVGGRPVPVDVRVVAATHRDLGQSVRDGKFREDLLYRLNVVPIHMPPLRDRIADIVPLAEHFLREAGGPALGADAAAALLRHRWPGNVRELKNAMHRVAALVRAAALSEADVAFLSNGPAPEPAALDEDLPTALERVERMLIERALQRCRGNRTEAARLLNIRRQHLYSRMEKYGLMSAERTPDVRQADDEP